jgi:O-antigen biosynthesis protein
MPERSMTPITLNMTNNGITRPENLWRRNNPNALKSNGAGGTPRKMKTLKEIFSEHEGKVVDKWTSYIPEYDRLFGPLRDEPIALLEIGVENGGSLEIWDEHFPRANAIVGCDIDPACQMLRFTSDNIYIVIGDASSRECARQIAWIAFDFDIVIDDGSHNAKDVIASFSRYFPRLKRGGVYIIEDLHCSYWNEHQGGSLIRTPQRPLRRH